MERVFGRSTISPYKLSFCSVVSVQRALSAAVRPRPPCGRARPSPLRIKKALASKYPLRPFGAERPGAAASPAGWPPLQHGAAARRRRAAAPQNTTHSHSETLCIEFGTIRRTCRKKHGIVGFCHVKAFPDGLGWSPVIGGNGRARF